MSAQFDSILAAVRLMSPDDKARIAKDAMRLAGDVVWVPNPGPQTDAYYSEADILLYGGTAGCGKTGLGVGLSLTKHRRSLFLRRTNKEASKIFDAYYEILHTNEGWNGQLSCWRLPDGRLIDVGGCQMEDDKQKHKGVPHDLICVGRGTPVLMADGGYLAIEELSIGDMVATLEGPRRISRLIPKRVDKAVRVSVIGDDGVVIAEQVQSRTHCLLSESGAWESYLSTLSGGPSAQAICSQSTESRAGCKYSESFVGTIRDALTWLGGSTSYLPRMVRRSASISDRSVCMANAVFDGLSVQGIGVGSSYEWSRDASPPRVLFGREGLAGHHLQKAAKVFCQPSVARDVGDDRVASLQQDSLADYSCEPRPCDARLLLCARPPSGKDRAQASFPQQGDVERPIPICSANGALGKIPKHTHRIDKYVHPYTKEIRPSGKAVVAQSCRFTPVGEVDLFDIEVEQANHYITGGGFVNKNCFDEVADFTETQFTFLISWNRSADDGQRCRVVCASNPPTTPEGMWVVKYWAPWLDPRHPNPAKPGELRWFLGGKEVDGPGPHLLDGKMTRALSRTFIPGMLDDNPDLAQTNYDATLSQLPEELRMAYRLGRFDIMVKDGAFQVIPTSWVTDAFARWSPAMPMGVPMSAISADIAQGGDDDTVLAYRYGPYYAKIVRKPGHTTPDGSSIAGLVASHRRDACKVVLDMTGGYGGAAYEVLRSNGIECIGFKGYDGSRARTRDGQFGFFNRRSEVYWKFREALDPDQPGGSQVALPESQELLLDLVTPKWEVTSQGIKITTKERVIELLGRSPDAGDAVVTCWSQGAKDYMPTVFFNHAEHGLPPQRSNIVDLGTRRAISIVGGRRR